MKVDVTITAKNDVLGAISYAILISKALNEKVVLGFNYMQYKLTVNPDSNYIDLYEIVLLAKELDKQNETTV